MEEENKIMMVNNIKEWLRIDSDISKITNELKEKKKIKKNITENLITIMKEKKVECFNTKEGSLLYKSITSKKPLNKKVLLNNLQEYFKNDKNSPNVEEIVNFVMENRELQEKETIKKKETKLAT
jgi:hypothetical protein